MNLLDPAVCRRFFLGQALTGLAANADFVRSCQEAACAPDSRLSAAERIADAAADLAEAAMERVGRDDEAARIAQARDEMAEREEIASEIASGRCCRECEARFHFPEGEGPVGEPCYCLPCGRAAGEYDY